MKKIYKILIWALMLAALVFGYYYLPIDVWLGTSRDVIWTNYLFPIIVNIIVYIVRTILLGIANKTMKGKIFRFLFSIIINFTWVGFLLWFVFLINLTFGLAITSFLIVAISLTFRDRINNVVSGAMIIINEGFEVGDLIETNGVQGIVEDISLNYTQIRQFNGIITILPNQMVFNSTITKFTNKISLAEENILSEEAGFFERYGDKISRLVSKGKKLTRFIKIIEIRPNIDPENLDNLLDIVFDKYEPLMGYRPIFYVNKTTFDRCSITLQLIGEDPNLIILYANSFLRDLLYRLYNDEVFESWTGELPLDLKLTKAQKSDM
jgi:small-conductance mechanosensitive channel